MFAGWGAKLAAAGAALLAILLIVWRIFAKGESVGAAKQEVKQQREAKKAKAKMDDAKKVKGEEDTVRDLEDAGF